jgi:hypothetical protein
MKDCFYLKLYNLIHLLLFLNSEAFWLNHSKNSNHLLSRRRFLLIHAKIPLAGAIWQQQKQRQ